MAYNFTRGRLATGEAYFNEVWRILSEGTTNTIYMVFFSTLFAIIIGLVIGVLLNITGPNGICRANILNKILGFIVNTGRSIPFVIVIIAVFPLSRHIVGTSIGPTAAIVPLTIAAIPFVARVVEAALAELGSGIVEAAVSTGASPLQIIFRVLLPESAPGLILGFTLTMINLLSFSAMAGLIGGGGLGHVAHRWGLQEFRTDILLYTIVILVILVQIIQIAGQTIARKLDKR